MIKAANLCVVQKYQRSAVNTRVMSAHVCLQLTISNLHYITYIHGLAPANLSNCFFVTPVISCLFQLYGWRLAFTNQSPGDLSQKESNPGGKQSPLSTWCKRQRNVQQHWQQSGLQKLDSLVAGQSAADGQCSQWHCQLVGVSVERSFSAYHTMLPQLNKPNQPKYHPLASIKRRIELQQLQLSSVG